MTIEPVAKCGFTLYTNLYHKNTGGKIMKLNFAIIDDCQEDIGTVKAMIWQYFSENNDFEPIVKEYLSGKEFLTDYKKGSFQIVFIDICMDEINGLDLSSRLRHTDKDIVIIFMSTTTEFVFQTFKAVPHGYLRKPFSFGDFSETMERALEKFTAKQDTITIKMPRYEEIIIINDIISVVSDNHNTVIKTTIGTVLRSISTYREISHQLMTLKDFFECNRGIIINLKYSVSISGNDIRMQDGNVYPVRKKDRKNLSLLLAKKVSNTYRGGFFS